MAIVLTAGPHCFGFSYVTIKYDMDITSFMSRLLPIYLAIPLRYFITFSCLAECVRILAFVYLVVVSLPTLRLSCIRTLCKRSLRVSLGERHFKIYRRMLLSLKHLNFLNSVAGTILLIILVAAFAALRASGCDYLGVNSFTSMWAGNGFVGTARRNDVL
jgi:hypothetical protein